MFTVPAAGIVADQDNPGVANRFGRAAARRLRKLIQTFAPKDRPTVMNRPEAAHEIDPAHFRRVMSRFATGVTVITVAAHGEPQGMTANAFMSGSLDPPLGVVSVARRARMHGYLSNAERFAVNILAIGQADIANHFAGRKVEDLAPAFHASDGVPVLADAAARITADCHACHDCGDHSLFVGHIRTMASDGRQPLVYHAGHYTALAPVRGPETPQPEFW